LERSAEGDKSQRELKYRGKEKGRSRAALIAWKGKKLTSGPRRG
jgi:hypothetical protein